MNLTLLHSITFIYPDASTVEVKRGTLVSTGGRPIVMIPDSAAPVKDQPVKELVAATSDGSVAAAFEVSHEHISQTQMHDRLQRMYVG